MSAYSRLHTAISDGILNLPAGSVHIMRPTPTYDVSAVGDRDVSISNSSFPDNTAWATAGYPVSASPVAADITIVVVPRSKALARSMVAQAAATSKLVIVDGQKTDGVDSIFKSCRKALGDLPSITKAHGRIFWFEGTQALAEWTAPPPEKGAHGFYTTAGVFSDGAIDKGSAVLAAQLPVKLPARMADLGAGWGYLSQTILANDRVQSLDLIEAEALSLDCARLNIVDERAEFHWADATQFKPAEQYQGIVMNPPFHMGRTGDPSLGQAFIKSAARMMISQGTLWMVANRHLPYEAALNETFKKVVELEGSSAFKVFQASRPNR